jgi:uncharacterized membrane protein YhhN
MLQKHLQFNFAFAIVFLVQLYLSFDPDTVKLLIGDYHYGIKPMITIFLIVYLANHTKFNGRFAKRIGVGLFFGLLGDCLLMFVTVDASFFILGLAAFLIGHLLYISAFSLDYKGQRLNSRQISKWSLLIVFVYCICFYWLLSDHLGELKFPVLVYAVVISVLALVAINRREGVNLISFNLILLGAVLFLVSDSILAYDKFVTSFRYSSLLIMSTYMLAQYFITIGTIERKVKKYPFLKIKKRQHEP